MKWFGKVQPPVGRFVLSDRRTLQILFAAQQLSSMYRLGQVRRLELRGTGRLREPTGTW
jgi:hypothetical protein